MKFDIFVIPFLLGLNFLLIYIIIRFTKWILKLDSADRARLRKYVFSLSLFKSFREINQEVLLHRKIFKTNPLLGYMHMSLALGWFMLIFIGNLQVKFFSPDPFNPPHYPIFLKFFEPNPPSYPFDKAFNFIMDFALLIVLSGVFLAWFKRFNSSLFGLKHPTVHSRGDKLALTALWFIFPLRLLAEGLSAAIYNNGSFLTNTVGHFFGIILPAEKLIYPAWWAYSLVLGAFFMALPFSRYMHIPAEPLLIIMRNAGIKAKRKISTFAQVEINACSRCGICIDNCQMSSALNNRNIQPSYFLRNVRYDLKDLDTIQNCLMCGRCNVACPVGIDSTEIRLIKRMEHNGNNLFNYSYLPSVKPVKADVLYFAGCMTHLTPSIKKSMSEIFDISGVSWEFFDKDGTICCGRPLLLAGHLESARVLIEKNTILIKASAAKTLVTSCPICYKAFKEEYNLDIEVLHHSQYLLRLIEEKKISLKRSLQTVAYHDPCELGRNSGIYAEPRQVINHSAQILITDYENEKGLCCGGSLGNIPITSSQKKQIASEAIYKMNLEKADALITGCPLCKKTFAEVSEKPVMDIAQLVASNLIKIPVEKQKKALTKVENTVYMSK
jgi:Fe-S oxidoreductase